MLGPSWWRSSHGLRDSCGSAWLSPSPAGFVMGLESSLPVSGCQHFGVLAGTASSINQPPSPGLQAQKRVGADVLEHIARFPATTRSPSAPQRGLCRSQCQQLAPKQHPTCPSRALADASQVFCLLEAAAEVLVFLCWTRFGASREPQQLSHQGICLLSLQSEQPGRLLADRSQEMEVWRCAGFAARRAHYAHHAQPPTERWLLRLFQRAETRGFLLEIVPAFV